MNKGVKVLSDLNTFIKKVTAGGWSYNYYSRKEKIIKIGQVEYKNSFVKVFRLRNGTCTRISLSEVNVNCKYNIHIG